ncbi:alpha/beta hydrolase family protein [Ceratobasidium sp. AG-Ba]|nr:alpha/beta hydrolase family protein [Ceratobasidium sp. AG-Ba]
MKATGGRYDIVSWDPRGVWSTFPRATCFSTQKDERNLLGGSPMLDGIEMRVDIASAKEDLARFVNQSSWVDTQLAEVGKRCTEYSPDVMQYVGTAATVRDMVRLHDYLVPSNETINYWGFSYGTIIGMYFANMFPERVGRLILDAVVHPEHWANQPPHKSWEYSIMTANISLAGFVSECVKAGPTRCNFTMENDSETKLRQRLVGLFNRAYDWKKSNASSPFGSGPLRQYIHREMYAPEQWPKLASGLASYDKRLPPAAISDYFLPGSSTKATLVGLKKTINIDAYNQEEDLGVVEYSQPAITCADAIDNHSNVTTKEVLEEVARVAQKYPIFGPMWSSVLYCHRWPVRAVERYTGPWYRSPSNKILIIGTEGDPITPFKWTKEVATSYGSAHAALVEQEYYGHPSTAMRSNWFDCKHFEHYPQLPHQQYTT